MASSSSDALVHQGPAIEPAYYPEYAENRERITPLYSTEVYMGSVVLLLSMSMIGLGITAYGHYVDGTVNFSLTIISVVATVAVFLIGLGITAYGFRKHAREDGH